jgi:DNA-binding MarR family transcriptional regulator
VYILLTMTSELSRAERLRCAEVGAACVSLNSRKAARALTLLYDEALRPAGIRSTQFSLLTAVGGLGPVNVNALADQVVVDRTTLTRNLALLVRARLVAVEAGKDRRTRLATLTVKGRAALERALPLWEEVQGRIEKSVGAPRLERLRTDLGALVRAAQGG